MSALPAPSGWFAIAAARELGPTTVLTRRISSSERVLFRGADGAVAAVDPWCPHLGAHLGRGGTVAGGELRCPFHGLRFAGDGSCVHTPHGSRPPRRARLTAHPTVETGGWILTWIDPAGGAPSWRPPVLPPDPTLRTFARELRTHPQETTENSVDLAHFPVVHGYERVELRSFESDGPRLRARYTFVRPAGLPFLGRRLRVDINVHVWGLGFSYVDVDLPEVGVHTRQFVLPTPVAADRVELRLGMTVGRRAAAPALVRWIPRWCFDGPIGALAMREYVSDVLRDQEIWEHKAYLPRPALLAEDGPIGRYRAWVRQFYVEGAA